MPKVSRHAARLVRGVLAAGLVAVLATCASPAPPAPVVAAGPPLLVDPAPTDARIPIPRAAPVPSDLTRAGIPTVEVVPLFHRPRRGNAYAFMGALNEIGQRHRLPVTATQTFGGDTWLRVLLPHQDFGQQAWVQADQLRLVKLREKLVVDLSSFTLRHYRNGNVVNRFRVGIGRPEFPTPLGTYFIMGKLQQGVPTGPYGVYTLGTSAFSPVIDDGRVGIHGTADPTDRGLRVSHGCIRVYNTEMVKLKRVPIGTPLVFKR